MGSFVCAGKESCVVPGSERGLRECQLYPWQGECIEVLEKQWVQGDLRVLSLEGGVVVPSSADQVQGLCKSMKRFCTMQSRGEHRKVNVGLRRRELCTK